MAFGAVSLPQRSRKELRRYQRYPSSGSLRAAWVDSSGELKLGHARILNVSEFGLAIELPEAPARNAMVRLQSEKLKLSGCSTVRHIATKGSKFVVGLELVDGLKMEMPVSRSAPVSASSQDDWFERFAASIAAETHRPDSE